MSTTATRISRQITKHELKQRTLLIASLLSLPVIAIVAISVGPASVNLLDVMFQKSITELQVNIITDIRVPRMMMTMVTGAGLAVSGVILQSMFKNPLADPGIVGVSAGSALFAAIGFWINASIGFAFIPYSLSIPLMAFFGAVFSIALLFAIAGESGQLQTNLLVLAGVAINTLATMLLGIIILLVDDSTLRQITFWNLGSYAGIGFTQFAPTLLVVVIGFFFLWRQRRALTLLSLGEKQARTQGIKTEKLKLWSLIATAAIVAVCVCFTGIVGFVGLVVPHICRMLLTSKLSILLPFAAVVGGGLVALADIAARTINMPEELPIGLLTSLLGVPFFIWLIRKQRGIR
ncbi:MAG: iron ABC transporter permease [Pseudomonadota bacterium]